MGLSDAEESLLGRALGTIAGLTGAQRDTIRAALAHLPGLNSLPSALAAEKKKQSVEALVASGPTPLTSQQRAIRNTPRKHYTGTGSGPNKFVNTKELPNTRIPVMRPPGKRAKKRAHVKYKWCVM
jgi:hypothetical protein